jgi:FkbM family methyltransferase
MSANKLNQIGKTKMQVENFITMSNRHGREYCVMADPKDPTKPHLVFQRGNGIYQVNNLKYLRSLVPNARRIVDVGANVGTNTIEYATWAQAVESFECNRLNFEMLEHNLWQNKFSDTGPSWYEDKPLTVHSERVTCYHAALMHQTGNAFVNHRHQGLSDFVSFGSGDEPVPTATIDSYNWTDVDAIKMDTEGTEWLVVQGADQTIRKCRPVVQIEMWGWEKRHGLNNQDMLDYFKSLNYRQTDVRGQALPWDYAGRCDRKHGFAKSAMDRFFIPN